MKVTELAQAIIDDKPTFRDRARQCPPGFLLDLYIDAENEGFGPGQTVEAMELFNRAEAALARGPRP